MVDGQDSGDGEDGEGEESVGAVSGGEDASPGSPGIGEQIWQGHAVGNKDKKDKDKVVSEGDGSGRRREWVDGLGVVDEEIVEDLCSKIQSLTSEDVWRSLKKSGAMPVEEMKGDQEGNQIRIAYQLCRDNKRMVEGCEWFSSLSFGRVELMVLLW